MIDTAVILAGGKSSRFGRPKSLEIIDGQPLIARLAAQISATGITEICISTDDPEPYLFLGLRIIPDRFKGYGPLAGIHSTLMETGVDKLFVLACDLPAIGSNQLQALITSAESDPAPVVFAVTESQAHPLCAVVRSEIIESLTATLEKGRNAVLRFFLDLDHRTVHFHDERPFINMNVPDDLRSMEGTNAL